jgi:uncharacterized membrane protein YesL
MDGLRAWWRGLRHLEHQGYIYIWANLLWVALSLPVVTAPAAWAGLIRMSHTAYTQPTANINDFWEGFRENFWRGLVLALINIVVIAVNLINLAFYRNENYVVLVLLRGVWGLALLVWFTLQFYMWPLFYEMETPSLQGALRNAAIMLLLNPGFTVSLWVGIVLILVVSIILIPLALLLTGGALAAVANSAVFDRLEKAGLRARPIQPGVAEFTE